MTTIEQRVAALEQLTKIEAGFRERRPIPCTCPSGDLEKTFNRRFGLLECRQEQVEQAQRAVFRLLRSQVRLSRGVPLGK